MLERAYGKRGTRLEHTISVFSEIAVHADIAVNVLLFPFHVLNDKVIV